MANGNGHSIYEFDEFRLDVDKLMLYRDEAEIPLPPKAIKTLSVLVKNHGEILSKDELIEKVWEDSIVEESNLSQYLYLLRKTLGEKPDGGNYIETLRRRGYRFTANVRHQVLNSSSAEIPTTGKDSYTSVYGFEPRGNVVALVDWREPVTVPSEAEPLSATPLDETRKRQPSHLTVLVVGVLLAAVASLLLAIFWPGPAEPLQVAAVKGDRNSVRLTNANYVRGATISRDGNYFVYHEIDDGTSRVWLQQTGRANRIEIVPTGKWSVCCLTFSPDGGFVYFVAWNEADKANALFRVSTLGGTPERILTRINSYVSFSPDGRQLAFPRYDEQSGDASLVIAASDGKGAERQILTSNEHLFLGNSWSPDGAAIAVGMLDRDEAFAGGCTLSSVDVSSGSVRPISDEKWDGCARMEWLRDGSGFAMIGTRRGESLTARRDQVYFISALDGRSYQVSDDGGRYESDALGVTDDNSIIGVSYNRSSQIWSMDAGGDSGTAVQLTSGIADGRTGLAPMSDGRVGYIARAGDRPGIFTMDGDGSNQQQIADPTSFEELRATPDGRYFIYSSTISSGRSHLFRINTDGSNPVQLTSGDSNEVDSSISPDGEWLAYDSRVFRNGKIETLIKKLSMGGGEPIILSDDNCANPHFSPDGRYISCVYYDKSRMAIISADDGSKVATFETVKVPTLNIGARWTPDGEALVYLVEQKNTTNLWRQPIDGGKAEPLTNFTGGSCYNFAFSSDGTKLYIARGYQVRDAVLIKNFR